jgi:hypothetical protein
MPIGSHLDCFGLKKWARLIENKMSPQILIAFLGDHPDDIDVL